MFDCYHNDPGKTAEAIDADGWYHSGDLGAVGADGRLRYLGRLKDMLKVGGENVAALEIASYLQAHPCVSVAQVVGVATRGRIDRPYKRLRADHAALRPGPAGEHGAGGLGDRAVACRVPGGQAVELTLDALDRGVVLPRDHGAAGTHAGPVDPLCPLGQAGLTVAWATCPR